MKDINEIQANQLAELILQAHNENGGSTFDWPLHNCCNDNGYVVSPFKRYEKVLKSVGVQDVSDFIYRHLYLIKVEGYSVGTWFDPSSDLHYLDIVKICENLFDALHIAEQANQKAVYCLHEKRSVYLDNTI